MKWSHGNNGRKRNKHKWNHAKLQRPFGWRFIGMEGLEKLRPFVWLCQLCGFFPYRMELDPVTKRFKRFTFSFWHPVTFWFIFVILVQMSIYFILISNKEIRDNISSTFSKATSVELLAVVTQTIDLAVIYVVVYRLSLVNRAVEFLQQADESLGSIPNKSFNIAPRIYIGVAYTFIWVHNFQPSWFYCYTSFIHPIVWFQTVTIPYFIHNMSNANEILEFYIIYLIGTASETFKSGCLLTILYLCFYVLSHRIRHLTTLLSLNIHFKPEAFDCGWAITQSTLSDR